MRGAPRNKEAAWVKVRLYIDHLIELNMYLASFPGEKLSNKIIMTDLNEILLNSMTNSWRKKAYVHIFDCGYITFKKDVNMFKRMDISESIYKGVVEPSYKNY